LQADTLYFGRTYDPAGRATEKAVETCIYESKSLESFNTSLLQEPWEVKNGSGRPFQVFHSLLAKITGGYLPGTSSSIPLKTLSFSNLKSDGIDLDELELLPDHDWHLKLSEHWDVSEKAAHKLIQRTADVITRSYATARNIPSKDGTSRLSPYLAWGLVSPRQICQAVLTADNEGGHRGENKYLVEIGWREFSYQLLYHFPHIADQPLREKYSTFPWLDDKNLFVPGSLETPDIRWWMPG